MVSVLLNLTPLVCNSAVVFFADVSADLTAIYPLVSIRCLEMIEYLGQEIFLKIKSEVRQQRTGCLLAHFMLITKEGLTKRLPLYS